MDSETEPQPSPLPKTTFKDINHNLFTDLLFGTISGFIGRSVFYPLENLQKAAAAKAEYKTFKRREAYFSSTPQIFKEGGLRDLFKGFIPTVNYALLFGCNVALFYQIKYTMYPKETIRRDVATKGNIFSGLLSSFLSYIVLTPLLKMEAAGKDLPSMSEVIKTIKKGQVSSMYKHWQYDLPAVLLSQGLLIGLYETKFKKQYYQMQGRVPLFMRLCDAYALAIFCGFVAYPFEHGKKRLIEALKKKPENPHDVLREMAQKEGSKMFLKGISGMFLTQFAPALTLTIFYSILEKRKDGELP